ncbi:hypothetical protein [Bacillus sp. FJAT-44742]|uniref:hypothetical protein n=1 Tax=Bacillus sp. FJAT-44742 TaxID=2014005 RepID=UPI000C239088|nr:hypothetical protein [Bacillus sp. FJAT-44742]
MNNLNVWTYENGDPSKSYFYKVENLNEIFTAIKERFSKDIKDHNDTDFEEDSYIQVDHTPPMGEGDIKVDEIILDISVKAELLSFITKYISVINIKRLFQ